MNPATVVASKLEAEPAQEAAEPPSFSPLLPGSCGHPSDVLQEACTATHAWL